MDLIDKEHSRDDFSLAFFSPLGNSLVDLFSDFLGDLSSGS